MDTNIYQWGYESIYEEDALSVATAQIGAWKERLEMKAQLRYEEDALSAAAAQLAAWKERLEKNVVISPTYNTCGATHSTERCQFANDDVQSESNDAYSSITIQVAIVQSQYVPPEPNSSYQEIIIAITNDKPNSSYQEIIIATTNDIGVEEKTKNVENVDTVWLKIVNLALHGR
ncbi:hypothetical protein ACLOJK_036446 [Asimina triloba]